MITPDQAWRWRWWWPLVFGCGAVGIVGSPWASFFVGMTFPVLSLGALWVAWSDHKAFTIREYLIVFCCYALGWSMECLGVQTGWVFGAYQYGPWLGPRWLGVPPLIGLNWVILVWAVRGWIPAGSAQGIRPWLRDMGAALLVMGMDLLIEPGATRLGFWNWEEASRWSGWVGVLLVAPLKNYLAWWAIAYLMLRGMSLGGVQGDRPALHRAAGYYALWMMMYFLILTCGILVDRV